MKADGINSKKNVHQVIKFTHEKPFNLTTRPMFSKYLVQLQIKNDPKGHAETKRDVNKSMYDVMIQYTHCDQIYTTVILCVVVYCLLQ